MLSRGNRGKRLVSIIDRAPSWPEKLTLACPCMSVRTFVLICVGAGTHGLILIENCVCERAWIAQMTASVENVAHSYHLTPAACVESARVSFVVPARMRAFVSAQSHVQYSLCWKHLYTEYIKIYARNVVVPATWSTSVRVL